MNHLDQKKLTAKQRRALYDAYRYIRKRVAWHKAREKDSESENDITNAGTHNPIVRKV